jgi:hypothetical protein
VQFNHSVPCYRSRVYGYLISLPLFLSSSLAFINSLGCLSVFTQKIVTVTAGDYYLSPLPHIPSTSPELICTCNSLSHSSDLSNCPTCDYSPTLISDTYSPSCSFPPCCVRSLCNILSLIQWYGSCAYTIWVGEIICKVYPDYVGGQRDRSRNEISIALQFLELPTRQADVHLDSGRFYPHISSTRKSTTTDEYTHQLWDHEPQP